MIPNLTLLLENVSTTGPGTARPGSSGSKTFEFRGVTTSGVGSAVVDVEGTCSGVVWSVLETITLTLGTAETGDSFTSFDSYTKLRGNVKSISGTGAICSLSMGATA